MGFVRTVVRRQVAAYIDDVVHSRREELHLDVGVRVADARNNPEQSAAFRQKVEFMTSILSSLTDRDREILTRFYLDEQTQEQICEDMNLTETQFRLLKSRAKARFGELGKRKLQQKPLGSLFFENFRAVLPLTHSSCRPRIWSAKKRFCHEHPVYFPHSRRPSGKIRYGSTFPPGLRTRPQTSTPLLQLPDPSQTD